MITVCIADDHDLIREGIRKILSKASDLQLVGEAQHGPEVLDLIRRTQPDVLILDITMPGVSGLDLLQDIRKQFKKTSVLIVSMHPEERFAVRALRNGASGYLTKDKAGEHLVEAVRKIAAGGRFITDEVADRLAEELQRPENRAPHTALSDREFQVFLLLASGKTVSAVAEELNLGVTTISTYRTRILEKMSLSTNAELTRYAYAHKLLE